MMASVMRHRGPDDEGYLAVNSSSGKVYGLVGDESRVRGENIAAFHNKADLLLAHRRLSIIDLSNKGHQPMSNARGDIWITYNGEIYNYVAIREELTRRGRVFRTDTDTEVLLAAYEEWGEKCLERFDGMWSFVIYDKKRNVLFGARDRFGVKPFYYFNKDGYFVFASEVKAIVALPFVEKRINRSAVFDYLVTGLEEAEEEGFFSNVFELLPATAFEMDLGRARLRKWRYYSLECNESWEPFDKRRFTKHVSEVRGLVIDAVGTRLLSDVPVGSCLSGGLDSSSIVCVINNLLNENAISQIGTRPRTFTAGYEAADIDESAWAGLVAKKTRALSFTTRPCREGLMEDLEALVFTQDFPFGSTSIYAQYCVMKLANKEGVKVLLDGQGADELFSGYPTHYAPFYAEMLSRLRLFSLLREVRAVGNAPLGGRALFGSLIKYLTAGNLPAGLVSAMYKRKAPELGYLNAGFWSDYRDRLNDLGQSKPSSLNRYLLNSLIGNGLKTLLRYEDRNSMRFSVEARTPFADNRALIEYVFSIPAVYKIHNGWSKAILRKSMEGIVPGEISRRRDKIGFATPEHEWLRGSKDVLKEYVDRGIDDFIDTGKVLKDWESLIAERPGSTLTKIWRFINLGVWRKVYKV